MKKGNVVTVAMFNGKDVVKEERQLSMFGKKILRFAGHPYNYLVEETLISAGELRKRCGSMPLCILSDDLSIDEYRDILRVRLTPGSCPETSK